MKKLEVTDYENALKDLLELKKNQLNNLLNNSIPNQFSNIKTLLWINFTLLSIVLLLLSKNNFLSLNLLTKSLIYLIGFNIVFLLYTMFKHRQKFYGDFDADDYTDHIWNNINGEDYDYSSHLMNLIKHIEKAINENIKIIESRGNIMHIVTFLLICSIILFAIIVIGKGG